MGKANELTFQNDMIRQLQANGWLPGDPEKYNRKLALYEEDVLGFVQDAQWQKFCKLYPNNPEQKDRLRSAHLGHDLLNALHTLKSNNREFVLLVKKSCP